MAKALKWFVFLSAIVLAVYAFDRALQRSIEQNRLKAEAREQQAAEEAVEQGRTSGNVSVHFRSTIPILTADVQCQENVYALDFAGFDSKHDSSFDYSPLRKLTKLRELSFYAWDWPKLLGGIAGMESVEELGFFDLHSIDECSQLFAALPNLKRVSVACGLSDDELKVLRETLPGVELDIPPDEEPAPAAER